MKNLSLNDIASRIADAVLEHRIVSKTSLVAAIRPILEIWIKKADATKKYNGKKTPLAALQKTIESRDVQSEFWRQEMIKIKGKDNMREYYDNLDSLLIEKGYKNPK